MVSNFKNKRILVMGLGLHGGAVSVVKWLLSQGAYLTVTDLKTRQQLKSSLLKIKKLPRASKIKYTLGRHEIGDFKNQDLLVQNPGVPADSKYLKLVRNLKIPIVNEAVMFFGLYPGKIIGITGTRGKSTTTILLHKILKTQIKNNMLAGNVAINPMFTALKKLKKNSWPVVELSSWHLEGLREYKKSPAIAVVTNVLKDHLNRYKSFADYAQAKLAIVKYQQPGDLAILNADNAYTRSFAKQTKAKVYFFSLKKKVKGVYLQTDWFYFNDGKKNSKLMPLSAVKLLGQHNLYNVAAALTVAKLLKITPANIKKAVSQFKGADYRLEYKGEVRGVRVYNDATSTSPDGSLAALWAFSEPVVLVAGGVDKELDFKDLAKQIKKQVSYLVLLPGSASRKLLKELKKLKYPAKQMTINVNSLERAWQLALTKADKVLLFSPAAASFNMFVNEFDRARQWDKIFYDYQKKKRS
jgi:UDP-N-acetylmuramoylalanine--D-glutamate ligase